MGEATSNIARQVIKDKVTPVPRPPLVQVAARFLLAKHREFVHEMFLDGLMNEKVGRFFFWCIILSLSWGVVVVRMVLS